MKQAKETYNGSLI